VKTKVDKDIERKFPNTIRFFEALPLIIALFNGGSVCEPNIMAATSGRLIAT
jgi:hypothetical protein